MTADTANIAIPHEVVISLVMKKEKHKLGRYDFFVRLTMKMQKEQFQVYNFELSYRQTHHPEITMIKFYMVPLGAFFKPRRQTQTRETILREYAMEGLEIFRKVLPAGVVSS